MAHDDADAPVLSVERLRRDQQIVIREADDTDDLALAQPAVFHHAARAVGAIGRELPVRVAAALATVLAHVGVTLDGDVVGQHADDLRDHPEQARERRLDLGGADLEEEAVVALDELDAQALRRHLDAHLVLERAQVGVGLERGPNPHGRLGQRGVVVVAGGACRRQRDDTGAGRQQARLLAPGRQRRRIPEIGGDRRANDGTLLGRPQHDEERHHRRHEVGVRDLPRAVGMLGPPAPRLPDDERRLLRIGPTPADHAGLGLTASVEASTSTSDGRSWVKMARRANSTATNGAAPFEKATTPALRQCR